MAKVTKDMTIGEILALHPKMAQVLMAGGMHCVGCGSSAYESLAEACQVHGLDPDEVIEYINKEMEK